MHFTGNRHTECGGGEWKMGSEVNGVGGTYMQTLIASTIIQYRTYQDVLLVNMKFR